MFVFAKHKTHKMQLRVYEGREFPLSGATNASQSISKKILLIFLSSRKNSFVYIILQLGANTQNATTVIAIVNVYIALTLCQGQSCFIYHIPSLHQAQEVSTSLILYLTNVETKASPCHTVSVGALSILFLKRFSLFSSEETQFGVMERVRDQESGF